MDLPAARFVRAGDGTAIAYRVLGDGWPTVLSSWPLMWPMSAEWQIPEAHALYEHLASGRQLISIDSRGVGTSGGAREWSSRPAAEDVLAVADELGVERFAVILPYSPLLGFAIEHLHPGRVSRLATYAPIIDRDRHEATSTSTGFQQFGRRDPNAYGRLQAEFSGLSSERSRELLASIVGQHVTAEDYAAWLDSWSERDHETREMMPGFEPPLLSIHREHSVISPEQSRILVAGVPNGRLHVLPGDALSFFADDWEAMAVALERFLDEDSPGGDDVVPVRGGFQTILFTDLEASTPLTQRLGDEGAQEILRGHNATVRGALDEHGGREVKHTGDGIMASFPSAVAAVTAALQIQQELAGGEVRVRIGLNAGEPIAEDDDLFGLSVIKAARIADRAEPGQILVSNVVMQLCEGKTFAFDALGEVSLKGFDQPVELFRVTA